MIKENLDRDENGDPSRGISFIQDAFATEQECLFTSLTSSRRIRHCGDRGEVNEIYFIEALRRCLPDRYTVDKAAVLDSTGKVSDSIDVVIFDRQYTPTLLDSDHHRYVPAESVYAVFECKPKINKEYLEYAADKAASVRMLKRTSMGVMTIDGPKPARPLPDIIAGILAINVEWSDGLGKAFESTFSGLAGERQLDCGFAAAGATFDTFGDGSLTFGPEGNAWTFFIFRLLDRLRVVGTVPAVDWSAYAQALSSPIVKEVANV
ncbi:DUF6602 domain-containing protein [Pelagicoccus sp. SDUM812002]|uniref:DUF6602 domain-containing protein n=1 Tax=Pelagicoccus sp. SDUM812002 TaxID=3041266 RepID=UPI00280E104F|nr:DUF6602 domain-containing protein [Pelagicoccus sp. SDUM812002]MDQ8184265.1 hypothetical protein [Pelagicoccus sp. SDUM812002]